MNYSDYGGLGLDEIVGATDEEVMAELLSGDDEDLAIGLDEIIGSMPAAQRKNFLRKVALSRSNPVLVRKQARTDSGRLILPIPQTAVAAGAVVDINIAPQMLFQTKRIEVPSDIAFFFDITDFKIGQKPQLVASGAIPCSCFTEVAVNADVQFDSADVGNQITLSVRNNDAAAQTFKGILLGTSVK